MERYIFLDIDGVLNSDSTTEYTPNGYVGVSNENITVLKEILNVSAYRGEEIDTYVKQHNLKNWIVIDDEYFFDFNMYQIYSEGENPRFLMTDYRYGLQPSDVEKAKILFNLQEN